MTDSETKTSAPSPAVREAAEHHVARFLAVVDGSELTNRVVKYLVSLAEANTAMEVIVLNVQSKRHDRLRGYESFKRDEIDDRLITEIGTPIVANVSRRLEKAGIRAGTRVEIGDPVDTIMRCAAEDRCDAVVVGEKRLGPFRRTLAQMGGLSFGSLAIRLALLSRIPVIVVK